MGFGIKNLTQESDWRFVIIVWCWSLLFWIIMFTVALVLEFGRAQKSVLSSSRYPCHNK